MANATLPKLACLCCTYKRPHILEHAVESFLRQDYPKNLCELIVLDDAGQLMPCSQENWHVVSTSRRFRTLGEKRNACAALSNPDVDAYVVWDDDDIYLPHTLRAHADALSRAEWSRPSLFLPEKCSTDTTVI
jgi:cellulose synthase/poly-beta-1,6-N-acetylglucosamine synthase-like glycosyltransferase